MLRFELIPLLSIDTCGVSSQPKRLSSIKAHGPDEHSPQLLKPVAEEFASALIIIFPQSYDLSSTPKDWNSAIVTPIFKKVLNSDPSNYASISLACTCSKIIRHVMPIAIVMNIAKSNILISE